MKRKLKSVRKIIVYALTVIAAIITAAALSPATAYAADNPLKITVGQVSPFPAETEFTYILKPLSPENPMPQGGVTPGGTASEDAAEGYAFKISGTGEKEIGPLSFDRQGLYIYELFQLIKTEKPGHIYDRRVYTLEVHVNAELSAELVILNGDGTKTEKIEFQNGYEKINVAGSKTWEHGGNTGKKPESIVIRVMSGNAPVAEKRIGGADNWAWSFPLPKYDLDGKLIVYTVEEENVPGYTLVKKEGYSLTNEYKGPNYPGDKPPVTGDDSNIGLWLFLLASSAVMLIIIVTDAAVKRKRKLARRVK